MSSEIQVADAVSTRWAEALHSLATQKGALDEVRRDMNLLAGEVANPSVRAFLSTSSIPLPDKTRALEPLVSKLSKWTQNVVKLAIERRREGLLVGLPDAFQRCEDLLTGVVKGVAEGARELGQSEIQELERNLTVKFGKKVVLTTRKNPELIGGVRVFLGANMIDRSVQGRLDALSRKMRNAPLGSTTTQS